MIRLLEEVSLGAWPALATIFHDGWILRFADGYTRRANSVNPLYPGTIPIDEKIAFCESAYRAKGQRVVFKMTETAEPRDLDRILTERGYAAEARTDVMTCGLADQPHIASRRVREWHRADDAWLTACADLNGVATNHRATLASIVGSIASPLCCAALSDNGEIASCGMAVVQDQWVGLFDIVTHEQRRRQGLAGELIAHLLAWARRQGARHAYLQVMRDNPNALRLYDKIGFTAQYEYWYRVETALQPLHGPISGSLGNLHGSGKT